MHRLSSGVAIALLVVASACTASPIGDPCIPETIPAGGFDAREVYIETSSVQCRTRVCMVYRLLGDPSVVCDDMGQPAGCLQRDVVNNQVFCSCRCSGPPDADTNTPLCNCGHGYRCLEDDEPGYVGTTGGIGVQGGYCVPCSEPGGETLGPPFTDCPTRGGG